MGFRPNIIYQPLLSKLSSFLSSNHLTLNSPTLTHPRTVADAEACFFLQSQVLVPSGTRQYSTHRGGGRLSVPYNAVCIQDMLISTTTTTAHLPRSISGIQQFCAPESVYLKLACKIHETVTTDLTGKAKKNSTTTVLYIDILAKATAAVPYPGEKIRAERQKEEGEKERKREGSTSAELLPTRSDYLYNTEGR